MAKRKYEFRPDNLRATLASKLYLTPKQRLTFLRWFLICALLVVVSVLQDVILCRFRFFGATTDLVPCGIILVCIIEGMNSSCIFALVAACLYQFSGGPGYYCIALIVVLGIFISYFRQNFLQPGFSAAMLCMAVALLVYELVVFAAGLLQEITLLSRFTLPLYTALLTLVASGLLYPLTRAIGSIGGEKWKE